jgi:hypothetical protein
MIKFFNSPGSFRDGHYTDAASEVETQGRAAQRQDARSSAASEVETQGRAAQS